LGANTAYIAFKVLLVLPLFIKVFEKELKNIVQKITLESCPVLGSFIASFAFHRIYP
jgi:hypothetical protein